jgi:hypothetical protein
LDKIGIFRVEKKKVDLREICWPFFHKHSVALTSPNLNAMCFCYA